MANPYDHRELLAAHYGFSGKTVDEVVAAQKERDRQQRERHKAEMDAEHRTGKFAKFDRPKAPAPATVTKSQLDSLRALQTRAVQAREARTE